MNKWKKYILDIMIDAIEVMKRQQRNALLRSIKILSSVAKYDVDYKNKTSLEDLSEDFFKILQHFIHDDTQIVFDLYNRLSLEDFGLFGFTLKNAKNIRQLFSYAVKFHPFSSLEYVEHQHIKDDFYVIKPVYSIEKTKHWKVFDLDFVAGNLKLLSLALNQLTYWEGVHVFFRHSRPDRWKRHPLIKSANVWFNSDETKISFPSVYLDIDVNMIPHIGTEQNLQNNTLPKIPDSNISWTEKCHQVFQKYSFTLNKLEEVAEELGVSTRMLRQHLYNENTSFRTIITNARIECGKYFLENSKLNGNEISEILGYSQPSAFFRAFLRYQKVSTKEYIRNTSKYPSAPR